MHSGIRGATELLQQEVGQAGRVSLPGTVTLTAAVSVAAMPAAVTASGRLGRRSAASDGAVSSVSGMFADRRSTGRRT